MSEQLLELEVLPLYAQVGVQDADTTDLPDWQTGNERAVATTHAILVATRPDTEGKVVIRVIPGSADAGTIVFDGALDVTSGLIEVGNAIAGTVERVVLRNPGVHRVQIAVDAIEAPAVITVAIEGA
jgi:hypothetical protein